MKKVLSLILVLVMCLSLCACGTNPAEVKTDLVKGKWSGYLSFTSNFFGVECYGYFDFHEDGTVDYSHMRGDDRWEPANGATYQIRDGEILLTCKGWGDDTIERIKYEYKNGELRLTFMDGTSEVFLTQEQ